MRGRSSYGHRRFAVYPDGAAIAGPLADPFLSEAVHTPMSTTTKTPLEAHLTSVLDRHPHLHRRRVRIEQEPGRLVLRGVVGSFYEKQMAQESLRRVEGVERIDNELEVCWT